MTTPLREDVQRLTVTLPAARYAELKATARGRAMSITGVVNELINNFLRSLNCDNTGAAGLVDRVDALEARLITLAAELSDLKTDEPIKRRRRYAGNKRRSYKQAEPIDEQAEDVGRVPELTEEAIAEDAAQYWGPDPCDDQEEDGGALDTPCDEDFFDHELNRGAARAAAARIADANPARVKLASSLARKERTAENRSIRDVLTARLEEERQGTRNPPRDRATAYAFGGYRSQY